MDSRLRVFIIAENRLLREALARIFRNKTDIEVIGLAERCSHALPEVVHLKLKPDVLLLNPTAPDLEDRACVQEIHHAARELKIIAFGMEENEQAFLQVVRAGVVAYVLKDASAADIIAAVRSVAQGEAICPPRLCLALFNCAARQSAPPLSFRLRAHFGLTRREQQLMPLIAQGLTNKEIAAQLQLSEQTVKNHVHRMLQKSGASGRLEMIERCRGDLFSHSY